MPTLISNWREYVIYYTFLGIFIFFSIFLFNKGFFSFDNLLNIARQTAMISIMAVGMTFVLTAGEIDLSFGAIVALSAIIAALVLRWSNSVILSFLAGISCGMVVGLVNGIFVAKIGIPSFLITLGMSGIITGLARWISRLQSIAINNDIFTFIFGSGDIGFLPILFVWTVLIGVLGHIFLKKSPYGRRVLASGGNREAALYSGINVSNIKLSVLVINGGLAALAGILYTGRLHGARYTLGENDLLIVIASVIIGGTSLFGGKGTVVGSIIGAIIMGMLNNGLILFGFTVDWQLIARGIIIIVAVSLTLGKKK